MRQSWLAETHGTPIREFLAEYQGISAAVLQAEKNAIEEFNNRPANKKIGKTCSAPRMTGTFKKDPAVIQMFEMIERWAPKLSEESPWEFTERDPLPNFYDQSLIIAKRYQRQWGHLPPSLHTEFAFDVPWGEHQLTGFIDAIEPLVDRNGELHGLLVNDYKSYRAEPAELKDYRQLVIYDVAVREYVKRGVLELPFSLDEYPLHVGIDYVGFAGVETDWPVLCRVEDEGHKHGKGECSSGGNSRAFWKITEEDRAVLRKDLDDYTAIVKAQIFRPAPKSAKADFCDYGELCCLRNAETRGGCAERVAIAQ